MNSIVEMLGQKRLLLTERALKKVCAIIGNENIFCISVDPGGCNGFEYNFEVKKYKEHESHQTEGNFVDSNDLTGLTSGEYFKIYYQKAPILVVDNISLTLIENSIVDYIKELIGEKFVIKNPKSKSSCSCGASFGI